MRRPRVEQGVELKPEAQAKFAFAAYCEGESSIKELCPLSLNNGECALPIFSSIFLGKFSSEPIVSGARSNHERRSSSWSSLLRFRGIPESAVDDFK